MSDILLKEQSSYIYSFIQEETDPIIKEIESLALQRGIPILDKLSLALLKQLTLLKRPKVFLEIGAAICYSTISIAKILSHDSKIIAIEKSPENFEFANRFIEKSGFNDKIKLLLCEAKDYLSETKDSFDFIFLDADKEDYKELFYLSIDKLRFGGVIFIDNLLWHGYAAMPQDKIPDNYKKSANFIKEFNEIFIAGKKLFSQIYPIGDGIGIGYKINN